MLAQPLAQRLAQGKVSHAWLLTGPEPELAKQAETFAQGLLCQDLQPSGQPCGHCAACRQVLAGNHPDLQEIWPEGLSVKIHQTRKMQRLAFLESYEGGRQVFLIHQAQTMQVAAANSVLKLLEEPPQGVYFILTAPVRDGLLPTILSRLVWQPLPPAAAADAALPQAEEALQQEMLAKAEKLLGLLQEDASVLLLFAAGFKEDKKRGFSPRQQARCFLQQLLACPREAAMREVAPAQCLLPAQPRHFGLQTALAAAAQVEEAQELLEHNLNVTLLLSVLFLRLQDLRKKQG